MGSVTNSVYNAAKAYCDVAETGAAVAYYGSDAAISCAEAIFSTTATGWNLGLKNSLKETVKWSLGFHDYKKAVEAFRYKAPAPVPNGNGAVIYDMRSIGKRSGEFIGHTTNGVAKAIASGAVAACGTAVLGGSISNALYSDADAYGAPFGEFHNASRLFAAGAYEVGKCVSYLGIAGAKIGFKATATAASVVKDHPRAVFNTTVGGAALYLAAKQIVKAGEADSYIRKVGHCSLAILGFGAMCLTPAMNPF